MQQLSHLFTNLRKEIHKIALLGLFVCFPWLVGLAPPPNPSACLGLLKAPQTLRLEGQSHPLDHPCAQARIVRTARQHEALKARKMMSNHTDMQDKYCVDCADIQLVRSHYKVASFGFL